MRNAKNPYGNGNSAILTIDAIENFYNKGLLKIESPEDIMTSFKRKMMDVADDITVRNFEDKYNALVHLVYNNGEMVFPYDDLNLKDMMITYDKYEE